MHNEVTLTFLGDISLNDNYRKLAQEKINPFSDVIPLLQKSDLVIGNLEAICDVGLKTFPFNKTRLQTDVFALEYLKSLNLGMVSLANNHIFDNLEEGYLKTIAFLNLNEINYIGAKNVNSVREFHSSLTIKGLKFTFLNYLHSSTNPKIPLNSNVVVNVYEKEKILQDIYRHKEHSDILVLLFHWGMENSFYPEPWQVRDAKGFVEAGANIIIGHHTHTLQGFQRINKAIVFYSLGNFCFSPLLVNEKTYELDRSRHTESIILNVIISRDKSVSFQFEPVKIVNDFIKRGDQTIRDKFFKRSKLITFYRSFYWGYKLYLLSIHKMISYFIMNERNPIDQFKRLNLNKVARFIKQQQSIIKNG